MHKVLENLTAGEKLQLIEFVARSLRTAPTGSRVADQQARLEQLRRELAVLPVNNPTDGFSNRDHDAELYGGKA